MPGAQRPKTVKGAQSDPNYVSRLLARSECLPGGGKNYSYAAAPLPFPLPSEAGPLNTARGSVERCKLSHIGSRAKPQPTKRFGAYWSQKVQLRWQNFLLVFLRTNVIFCTKKAWYRTADPIPHSSAPSGEFFYWGSRHHSQLGIYACGFAPSSTIGVP